MNIVNIEKDECPLEPMQIKKIILSKINEFKIKYRDYPRYVIISSNHFSNLFSEKNIYYSTEDRYATRHMIFGLTICISDKVESLEDIEVIADLL